MCYFVANLWHVALDMYYVDGQKMDGQSIPISDHDELDCKKKHWHCGDFCGDGVRAFAMVFVQIRGHQISIYFIYLIKLL